MGNERRLLTLAAPVALALLAGTAAAEPPDRTGAPYLVVHTPRVSELPLEESRADVSIAGVIARVRVTQVYRNESSVPIEASYVFPASTRAAVFAMRMKVGTRTIEAKIEERRAARHQYERAKQEGRSAALLEEERANVFRMNVANILPGDRIVAVLDYTELLVPEDGTYAFIYPTVVGPRYTGNRGGAEPAGLDGAPAAAVGEGGEEPAQSLRPEDAWTASPTLPAGAPPPYRWGMSVKLSAGMPVASVRSPSHTISPRFEPGRVVRVEVDDEKGGDRDFILEYRLQGDDIETGLLLYPGEKESFFLMMMEPPERLVPTSIPPREYVFIIDVSGSMAGFPLETAKQTVREVIEGLRVQDRFNILTFAGGNAVLADESLYATSDNVERALSELDRLQGSGGTEILSALQRALALPRSPEMSTTFAVITDGFIDVEPEVFSLIRSSLGEANLFAFGIGTSVNRLLIEGMARAGMGQPFVVTSAESAAEEAARFRVHIQSPVLTNVRATFESFEAYDVEPVVLPDLFASRPIVLFGKYRGAPTGLIRISGSNAAGPFERAIEVSRFVPSDDHTALRYLWARDRIARLADLASVGEAKQAKEEVTRLGLAHNLLTPYTSFLAVDSMVRNTSGTPPRKVRQPVSLPRGVSHCELAPGPLGSAAGTNGSGSGSGSGGLGTSGIGTGGGGHGSAIGLGSYGTAGYGHGIALGYGSGRGGALGARAKGPTRLLAGHTIVQGSLDKDQISRIIRRNLARVKFCYEKELNRSPTLAGKLSVRFVIAPDGTVSKVEVVSSSLAHPVVEQCVLGVMRSLQYPAPAGAGSVVVTYPFTFVSAP